jgi:glycosyltransferase involved in cell wall biosynthesis
VVSELDCYRDILQPGINGFQFNQGSSMAANELAAILARLLGDAALRRTIAAQAQASTRAYDFPVAAERLIEEFGRRNHG